MDQFLSIGSTLFAAEGHNEPSYWGFASYLIVVVGFIFVMMTLAKKGINNRVFKNPITQLFEQLFLFIENMCKSIIGPHGIKYVPMVLTLWLLIFVGNTLALFLPFSPTADLSFNLGLALLSIGYVQWEGIRANGLFGHLSHFAGPKLGLAMIPITLMIFVIEIISELMKNVSLSLRLFGNIHGGHMAVEAMNKLGESIYVPFGAFLLPVKLLTCVVQAMIFTLLTCVYLSLVTQHGEDHGSGHDDHGQTPAMAH
ncbi:MAG: F-type H+-transporting ATPase subunit a [Fimbriimonadaceae bacterium]|jgi:F-type H+-transporting ATPase subunit a|nr:F-type H+-transporting ATPase subunit a [Fimbriimonadaceae bacterium]